VPPQIGISPLSLALAYVDWAWHLAASPGKQLELLSLVMRLTQGAERPDESPTAIGQVGRRPGFGTRPGPTGHSATGAWAFTRARLSGAKLPDPGHDGAPPRPEPIFARQWLDMMAPPNWLATNPVVWRDILDLNGAHLTQGARRRLQDVSGQPSSAAQAEAGRFRVGRDVAMTPGCVVFKNHLVELLRYAPQTSTVYAEPILIVPSWIMKYYILDLSPGNSLVRFLVGQGRTVYMLSWRNPDASDRDLSMDDYLRLGLLEALRAVATFHPADRSVHAVGYCLGGTLLAIAVAALARPGGVVGTGTYRRIRSVTLLAAQLIFPSQASSACSSTRPNCFLDNTHQGPGLPERSPNGSLVPVSALA